MINREDKSGTPGKGPQRPMTEYDEHERHLKSIIREEVDVYFLRFRFALVVTVLANLITVGVPMTITAVLYYRDMQDVKKIAMANAASLDRRRSFIRNQSGAMKHMQDYLSSTTSYKPPEPLPAYD